MENFDAFKVLDNLYEEMIDDLYPDAPGLDPNIEFNDEPDDISLYLTESDLDEEYMITPWNICTGDILLADVFQDVAAVKNLHHRTRPFLVIYANRNKAYGFQIGTSLPEFLTKYAVNIDDYESCGILKPCYVFLNMVRGVEYKHIARKIGHTTKHLKNLLINKLYEIKNNPELYPDSLINEDEERINNTIKNVQNMN